MHLNFIHIQCTWVENVVICLQGYFACNCLSWTELFMCGNQKPKPKKERRNKRRYEHVPCPASWAFFSTYQGKGWLWVVFLQICKILLISLNLHQNLGFYVSWDDWSSQTLAQLQSLRVWNTEVCLVLLGASLEGQTESTQQQNSCWGGSHYFLLNVMVRALKWLKPLGVGSLLLTSIDEEEKSSSVWPESTTYQRKDRAGSPVWASAEEQREKN